MHEGLGKRRFSRDGWSAPARTSADRSPAPSNRGGYWMVSLLAAAALAVAAPTAAPPEPAIFVVRDADTTVYLFGTFHALDGDPKWFDHGVRDAFEQSNELVLETLLPEG